MKRFLITYIPPFTGEFKSAYVWADNHAAALELGKEFGIVTKCEYQYTNTDLLYLH